LSYPWATIGSMRKEIQLAVDCADPGLLARFWADVLGYRLEDPPSGYPSWSDFSRAVGTPGEEWNAVVDPEGVGPRILFHRVPEGKIAKNRLHLDVRVSGVRGTPKLARRPLVDAEARRLVSGGATHVRTVEDQTDYFAVMQDPEGNEFCVC
jgi:catechol 2,3-dioxygenase-like lactoylglutathione lyase family enzyme